MREAAPVNPAVEAASPENKINEGYRLIWFIRGRGNLSDSLLFLIAFAQDEFRLEITASGSSTVTLVPSLVLEVYNSSGIMVIKIVAPS